MGDTIRRLPTTGYSSSSGSRTTGGSSALSSSSSPSSSSSSSSGSRGGIVLPMITKRLQSINLVENSSGMCCFMLLLLGCGPKGILPLLLRFPHEGQRRDRQLHERAHLVDIRTRQTFKQARRIATKVIPNTMRTGKQFALVGPQRIRSYAAASCSRETGLSNHLFWVRALRKIVSSAESSSCVAIRRLLALEATLFNSSCSSLPHRGVTRRDTRQSTGLR